MFNKLVVSTSEKRSKRTARFFVGTSIFYLTAVACAFALSILVANPRLADTSERIFIAPSPPPARLRRDDGPARREAQDTRQDLRSVRDLGDILDHPDAAPGEVRHGGPPSTGEIGSVDGVTGGSRDGVPDGLAGIIEAPGDHGNEAAPPPKPPDPPKPAARADDSRQPLRLTSTVLQGKAIVRRTPDYPPLGKQARLEGSVSVEVMIGPDGGVESARAVSGHPMLARAALDAARGWRFEPTLLNGSPVRVTGIIVFNFKLN